MFTVIRVIHNNIIRHKVADFTMYVNSKTTLRKNSFLFNTIFSLSISKAPSRRLLLRKLDVLYVTYIHVYKCHMIHIFIHGYRFIYGISYTVYVTVLTYLSAVSALCKFKYVSIYYRNVHIKIRSLYLYFLSKKCN